MHRLLIALGAFRSFLKDILELMKGNFAASGEILKHLFLPQLEVLMPDIQSFEAIELLLIAFSTIDVLAKHLPECVHLLLCELSVVPFAIQ